MSESRADAGGVRKTPRHEIAVEHVTAVPRALWGFGRRGYLNEFALKGLVRSFCWGVRRLACRRCVAARRFRCEGGEKLQPGASAGVAGRAPARAVGASTI